MTGGGSSGTRWWTGSPGIVSMSGVVALCAVAGCGPEALVPVADRNAPARVVVEPATLEFDAVGATHSLEATVLTESGLLLRTSPVTWSSRTTGVATVSPNGEVTSVGNGTALVVATSGRVSDTVTVTVSQRLVELEVRADVQVFRAHGIRAMAFATAVDRLGRPAVDPPAVEWTSSDPTVVTISADGELVSLADGEAVIRARTAELAAELSMRVDRVRPPEDEYGSVAFVGVDVLPMNGEGLLTDRTVVVRDEMIVAIGPADLVDLPPDAFVIAAPGAVLMPGLADMHVHFATETSLDAGGGQLLQYLANGVTAVFNQGDFGGPFPEWARQARERAIPSPTIYLGRYTRGPQDGAPNTVVVTGAENARQWVRDSQATGYDYIKVYNFTGSAEFQAVVDEGRTLGMSVVGHIPQPVGFRTAVESGQVLISHAGYGGLFTSHFSGTTNRAAIDSAIDLLLEQGTWLNPTLRVEEAVAAVFGGNEAGYREVFEQPGVRYTHPATRARWRTKVVVQQLYNPPGSQPGGRDAQLDFMREYVQAARAAGVPMIAGSDSPTVLLVAGFSFVETLRALERAGLRSEDVLGIATASAGRFVAETLPGAEPFGTVEVGTRADLLLLQADPREDLGNLREQVGVMARGRWRSAAELQRLLDEWATAIGR